VVPDGRALVLAHRNPSEAAHGGQPGPATALDAMQCNQRPDEVFLLPPAAPSELSVRGDTGSFSHVLSRSWLKNSLAMLWDLAVVIIVLVPCYLPAGYALPPQLMRWKFGDI
jgi:hypothetical protein